MVCEEQSRYEADIDIDIDIDKRENEAEAEVPALRELGSHRHLICGTKLGGKAWTCSEMERAGEVFCPTKRRGGRRKTPRPIEDERVENKEKRKGRTEPGGVPDEKRLDMVGKRD